MWMKEQKATIFSMDDDEYEVYCREPVLMVSDPLKWWLESAQRRRFPNLSLMAIDILSIAPMSTETERLFSKSKLTVTDQRGSMNIETLNLLECLRSWDRSALIVPSEVSIPLREVFDCLIIDSSVAISTRQQRVQSPMLRILRVIRKAAAETFCCWILLLDRVGILNALHKNKKRLVLLLTVIILWVSYYDRNERSFGALYL
jgi:hypothetical protein